jgi:hypothetical protein
MKRYYGNYLGIVIQNNDPEKRGRIKVYIPHVSPSIYDPWYDENIPSDKSFKFPGTQGNDSSLTGTIMDKLKEIVPWVECAMPLVGATGSGRYHAHSDSASISDTNKPDTFIPSTSADGEPGTYQLNSDNIGESPGRKYELQKLRLYDAFTEADSDNGHDDPNRANILSYNYTPNTYSNKAKGSFSIPNVGSHVWCFFENGDPMSPVYFAVSFGEEDWQSIYEVDDGTGYDYPGTFENKSKADDESSDLNTETYRNKFVINQKGGALEFINTDNKEILKMTHYSGSFKEFTNHANIELATKNDQKLVLHDSFHTVRGYNNSFVGRDSDNLIKGDHYIKIGKLDRSLHVQWRESAREIAHVKQLFENQRSAGIPGETYQRVSPLQVQSGNPGLCPVCNDIDTIDWYWGFNSSFGSVSVTTANAGGDNATDWGQVSNNIIQPQYRSMTTSGNIFGMTCPVCNGSGMSPSTMGGDYAPDPRKEFTGSGNGQFEKLVKSVSVKLKDIEKQLGRGGNQIVKVAKHKVETIGLAMNNFGSIRVDDKGKIYRDSVIIHPEGVFNSKAPSPLIEYVHVDDLPGGTYTLNIANRWNAQIGAGGVSFKSYGPVDIGGSIVNMAGEQVNVTSQSEVNIDGGKRLTLVADILSIRQRNRKQVLVDSNLGVSQNVVIGGGLHVEGETSLHHVTAPCEIQQTELAKVYAKLLSGLKFSAKISSSLKGTVTSKDFGSAVAIGGNCTITLTAPSNDDKVLCYDHSHHFKNLPLTLKENNDGVRSAGMKCNDEQRVEATQIQNTNASSKSS